MKKSSDITPVFVEYDDENLSHVSSGHDYGQPWSASHAWTEIDSKEYPSFVRQIGSKILKNPVRIHPY